jgi:hypothetical protein
VTADGEVTLNDVAVPMGISNVKVNAKSLTIAGPSLKSVGDLNMFDEGVVNGELVLLSLRNKGTCRRQGRKSRRREDK